LQPTPKLTANSLSNETFLNLSTIRISICFIFLTNHLLLIA